jgi:hypothetical protein
MAMETVYDRLVRDAVDLHCHIDVEFSQTLFRKAASEWEWLPEAEDAGMRAVVLKSHLFGGAVLAEQVFAYPGLGQATTTAALRQDVPLLLGIVLLTTVFVFVGNLLGDIAHRLIDPRVKLVTR